MSDSAVWALESHSVGKHLVLGRYMKAWLPIMTRWNESVLFVDGFAGPGEYSGGEEGSPLVVLRALAEHQGLEQMSGRLDCLFIENNSDRADHLEALIRRTDFDIPRNCRYQVLRSDFDVALSSFLDDSEEGVRFFPPSFVMIDPFGVSGVRMSLIRRIFENPKSEVYFSLMHDWINRFLGHPNFESHLDDLFGCPEWREALGLVGFNERKTFLFDLYARQLKAAGAKYVVHFELYEGEKLVYAIFFGTQSLTGCDKMKEAIWKVDPMGTYRFRGGRYEQPILGSDVLNFSALKESLLAEFCSENRVRIESLVEFMRSDRTEFYSAHLRSRVLMPMEKSGELEVMDSPRKRKNAYPDGTVLRFLST